MDAAKRMVTTPKPPEKRMRFMRSLFVPQMLFEQGLAIGKQMAGLHRRG